jgi:formylglycine-generating enzyme required for sulfatase activity
MNGRCLTLLLATSLTAGCASVNPAAPAPDHGTRARTDQWAAVPAGEFLSGQNNAPAEIDVPYEIMAYLVTVDQYAVFLNEAVAAGNVTAGTDAVTGYYPGDVFRGAKHEEEIAAGDWLLIPVHDASLRLDFDGRTFSATPTWELHPMTMVSWFGARAYCDFYGWRLPTELEWEKAARGTDGRPFPWGDEIQRENANYYVSRDPFEDMSALGSRTTPVGFYDGSRYGDYVTIDSPSPYGLYDMAGNVWQWTGDVYPLQHYRFLRGGSKDTYEMDLRTWVRNSATPTYVSPGAGFRCARDVQ